MYVSTTRLRRSLIVTAVPVLLLGGALPVTGEEEPRDQGDRPPVVLPDEVESAVERELVPPASLPAEMLPEAPPTPLEPPLPDDSDFETEGRLTTDPTRMSSIAGELGRLAGIPENRALLQTSQRQAEKRE